jgi:hypothetical protein
MKRYVALSLLVMAVSAGLASVIRHASQGDGAAAECLALAKLAPRYHPSQPSITDPISTEWRAFKLCVADPAAFKRLFHRAD